jgi:hypothetical protein
MDPFAARFTPEARAYAGQFVYGRKVGNTIQGYRDGDNYCIAGRLLQHDYPQQVERVVRDQESGGSPKAPNAFAIADTITGIDWTRWHDDPAIETSWEAIFEQAVRVTRLNDAGGLDTAEKVADFLGVEP